MLLALWGHDPEAASDEARAGALVMGEALLLVRAAIRGMAKGTKKR